MINILRRPSLGPDAVLAALREHYGIEGTLSPLPGERDLNFLFTGTNGERRVAKVSTPDETDEILEIEADLMRHMARTTDGFTADVIPSVDGDWVVKHTAEDGDIHRIRVVEYLEGVLFAEVRPRSLSLLYNLGSRIADLDSALGAYPDHPPARIDFEWALGRSGLVMERCLDLFQGEQLELIQAVHRDWLTREPDFLGLGSQVIHGDLNDYNVLVSRPGESPRRISGIIDLGDAHSAPRVFDLGIAIAYAILDTDDPLMSIASIVRGFHDRTPLSEEEANVVFTLAKARLGASVSISAWRRHQTGETDEYALISERPAWAMIQKLEAVPVRLAEGIVREAAGLSASPRTPVLVDWLKTQTFAPVMAMPETEEKVSVLDLSVSSPLLNGRDTEDAEDFTRRVFRHMEDKNASIGIGRYLEPRTLYLEDIFKGRSGDPRESRTVHTGIDIFSEAGGEVYAPLAGRIRSVVNNGQNLDYGPTVILEHDGPDGAFWTLYGHLETSTLEDLEKGSEVAAGECFARIGSAEENGGWPPHLHFQIITDLLGFEGQFPGVALPREETVWASFSPDPNLILQLPGHTTFVPPEDISRNRAELLGQNLSVAYDTPLHIVRGSGTYLIDVVGRSYLDCVNNVAHVGHERRSVVEAGQLQMSVLNTNTRYLHENVLQYGERLTELFPDPLSVCFFVNSGSEANDLALRMARTHTKGQGVVAIENGYHGHSQSLIDVSHYKHAGEGGEGAPNWVRTVPVPDDYRGLYGRDVPDRAVRYAIHVGEAFGSLSSTGHEPAAFIAESILSCGGQIEPPAGYLEEAYRIARSRGAVCIADEVQIGFGRVGSHMWGFQTGNVVPDIVTLGKPIGNGHPIGAVVTTPEIAESFANGMEFFSTFGGNPVSAAIGLAVLDIIESDRLQEHAAVVGGTLKANLASLAMRHESVGDVRGRGLFLGIEFVEDQKARTPSAQAARYIANRGAELGILLSTDGPDHNVIKIKPPMTFNQNDSERLVATLDKILAEDEARPRT